MKKVVLGAMALAVASTVSAAPNVTNVTQKGSLLIFPDIRVNPIPQQGPWSTLIRIQNDGSSDVDVKCYWMDGNKNRVDFIIPVTRNQAVWFDAASGDGTYSVNRFPTGPANGIDNPFLLGKVEGLVENPTVDAGAYLEGLLACWAVDNGAQNQVKWNHLSGTATVYNPGPTAGAGVAYEYNAYAFFVPTGLDLEPVGVAGTLNLNGVEYDSCPLYQIGQFTPVGAAGRAPGVAGVRLAIAGCKLNLNQDWARVWTKLQFDIWNEDEIKFTGAYECSDSWHETEFNDVATLTNGGPIDAAAQNFQAATLGTYSARYRVQGVKSTQCESSGIVTQAVGVLGVQYTDFVNPPPAQDNVIIRGGAGTTLAAAGKFTGKIVWDPEGIVPEGGIR